MTGLPNLAQPTPRPTIPVSAPVLPNAPDPAVSNNTLEALYPQVLPGVVSISTGQAIGSGFVFDSEGHVVTNQHVVEGSKVKWKWLSPRASRPMAR